MFSDHLLNSVQSYEGTESTGNVQISGCDVSKLAGKHVLFVEDIIDTGLTMTRFCSYFDIEDLVN